jgi:RNase P/RNase MRP subunit p29
MSYDRNSYTPVSGRVIRETPRAYLLLDQDLEEIWIPKSLSQEDGAGGLVVQNWYIEREGLE